ncbi:MAG: hypothetical protein JSR37_02315 [Verrucomicrobia bacterium]|nr:hypothetical protein [Verrucomicrobiota bacterium]MBS0637884.1 hypothetical protein [Verrucomicrobiota bacterium]
MQYISWLACSSSQADELDKAAQVLLEQVQQLKRDVDADADNFSKEKVLFQAACSQLDGCAQQVEGIEKLSQTRLPELVKLEDAYNAQMERVVQIASLALVPASVTALKQELDSSMGECLANGKMLQEDLEALKRVETRLLLKV